jgi:hypothetical protein
MSPAEPNEVNLAQRLGTLRHVSHHGNEEMPARLADGTQEALLDPGRRRQALLHSCCNDTAG